MLPEDIEALSELLQFPGWVLYQGLLEDRIRIAYKEIGEKDDLMEIYRLQGKIMAYRDAALVVSRVLKNYEPEGFEFELAGR